MEGFNYGVVSKENENWVVNPDAKAVVSNYVIFKEREASLIRKDPSCRGKYLVVNGKDSIFLHETEDSAFRGTESPYSFVARIGAGEFKEEVLALSAIEKLATLDALNIQAFISPIEDIMLIERAAGWKFLFS
eukprot:gene23609-31973_t